MWRFVLRLSGMPKFGCQQCKLVFRHIITSVLRQQLRNLMFWGMHPSIIFFYLHLSTQLSLDPVLISKLNYLPNVMRFNLMAVIVDQLTDGNANQLRQTVSSKGPNVYVRVSRTVSLSTVYQYE